VNETNLGSDGQSQVICQILISLSDKILVPVPVAARSKVWVFGRSLPGVAGSNPVGGMGVYVESVACCQVEVSASG